MSNSMGSGDRILEQRDLRRCESKYHEQHTNQANGSKSKQWMQNPSVFVGRNCKAG